MPRAGTSEVWAGGGCGGGGRDGRLIVSKITRMLQRKVDLWPPNELFELMPVLLRVGVGAAAAARLREGLAAERAVPGPPA